jgi:hypothetical protein
MPDTASAKEGSGGTFVRTQSFGEIFGAELRMLLPDRAIPDDVGGTEESSTPNDEAKVEVAPKVLADTLDELPESEDLAALCLSGGGIRSASFGLGVLQGLARCGWLEHFHYLSSVSGGGYIASWLTAWRAVEDDRRVLHGLNSMLETGTEPSQIRGVRANSNYITPELGLFSADTWTVVTIYVRNLLLNWLLFLPFFTGCLLFPRWYASALDWARLNASHNPGIWIGVGCALLAFALSCAVCGRFRSCEKWLTKGRFLLLVLAPIVASAIALTVAAALGGVHRALGSHPNDRSEQLAVGILVGAFVYASAWLIGRIAARRWDDKIIPGDVVCWVLSGGVVGLVIAWGMRLAAGHEWDPKLITVLGLSGVVLAYLGGDIFYVGASSFSRRGDMDREWLARASGWLAAVAVCWGLISALSIYGPGSWLPAWHGLVGAWGFYSSLGIGGGASGLAAVLLGRSSKTPATRCSGGVSSLTSVASAAAVIFAVILGVVIASFGQFLFARLGVCDSDLAIGAEFGFIGALIVLSVGISYFVNVNRFSLHALYRNRLVRAYLGSARIPGNRAPDPFTRFDPLDNPPVAALTPRSGADRLFHVINTTLNVVATKNTAWAERKAESFTITRQHCGNSFVGYQPTEEYGGPRGGITLGTAMAISGAAVSPNQGYNSSPLVGFLLMLFNVRLGWWLGNPRRKPFRREGPRLGISPALRELAGLTTDEGKWIYLSDGGHFDNLGLYEMVRRRCRFIVVIDAGCDPKVTLEDLGNAVRKIFIDFGVSIDFSKFEIKPRSEGTMAGARFATATITYPRTSPDGPEPRTGWLLYIKPTYYQTTEGVDVRGYASLNPAFPHESTTDQWFSESQLEAYRGLAAHIIEEVCCPHGRSQDALTLRALREIVERRAGHLDASEHHP